jgi:hypothetical protein
MRPLIPAALILFAILFAGCMTAKTPVNPPLTKPGEVVTGTITYLDFEGGFYGIVAGYGERLYPLNLDPAFEKPGLEVLFTYEPESSAMTTVSWGTPVTITTMEAVEPGAVTENESERIARRHVMAMPEYMQYAGRNLTLAETITLKCPSCWKFVYTFDMRSMKDPAVTDTAVVTVTVMKGGIPDVVAAFGKKES